MKRKFVFSRSRWIVFCWAIVWPVLAMVCGILAVVFGLCINRSFAITFILFPLAAAAFLALCIFSPMRRFPRSVLSALVLLLFTVVFLGGIIFGRYVRLESYRNEKAVRMYISVREENELMPSLDKIGQPAAIECCNAYTRIFVFFSDADYLICRYDAEEYQRQKKRLDEIYTFQTETLDPFEYPCEPAAEVNGYQFRMLSTEGQYSPFVDYPWYMTLIAYSDEKQEIVYLSFFNTDLDYLTSISDFLSEECGWQYVR